MIPRTLSPLDAIAHNTIRTELRSVALVESLISKGKRFYLAVKLQLNSIHILSSRRLDTYCACV